MLQLGSMVHVVDKTCVLLGRCIRVFGAKCIATLGDMLLLAVEWLDVKKHQQLKPRWQRRFSKGTMHRALMVRGKTNYCRFPGAFIKFNENAGVLVSRRVIPVSSRA